MIQYHAREKPNPQPRRTKFIAREQSYHGATLGALDLSGHEARKKLYGSVLPHNMHLLPPCNPYRNGRTGQTIEQYVEERKKELINKITELGPETVAGLIIEPVVGAVSRAFFTSQLRFSCTSSLRTTLLFFFVDAYICAVTRMRPSSTRLPQSHARGM